MVRYALIYAATLLVVGILDFIWLRVIAIRWYESGLGHLMASKPNWYAAAAFYLLYPIGVMVFATLPAQGEWQRAAAIGALFGLFVYGVYDLTNMAILRDWPIALSFADIAWGSFVTAAGACAGVIASRFVSS